MTNPPAYKAQACLNVFRLQIWEFFNDLIWGQPIGKQIQNVAVSNSHATDAGAATALLRINSDSFSKFHHLVCPPEHSLALPNSHRLTTKLSRRDARSGRLERFVGRFQLTQFSIVTEWCR